MNLTRMVAHCRNFLRPALNPGDLAVDLTAGAGQDTLFLYQCVGPGGCVLAFDIQAEALGRAMALLTKAGIPVTSLHPADGTRRRGVQLIGDDHRNLDKYLWGSPRGVVANLGYLPGGDPSITTSIQSTLQALTRSCERLAAGGRVAVVVYPGHPGGAEEAEAVTNLFSALPARTWQVLQLQAMNRRQAPFLLMAAKKEDKRALP
jgi:hypothetical protein